MSERPTELPQVESSEAREVEATVEPSTVDVEDAQPAVEAEASPAAVAGDEPTAAEGQPADETVAQTATEPVAEAAAEAVTEQAAEAEAETLPEPAAEAASAPADEEVATAEKADEPAEKEARKEPKPRKAKKKKKTDPALSMSPAVLALQERMNAKELVNGKVIGWNKGGFHVVCEGVTGFCPNSEMERGKVGPPKDYLDESYDFAVLRIEDSGRRVVLSRAKAIQGERSSKRAEARQKIQAGSEVEGKIASLTNFGAFVELGGVQGLIHVSEISRQRTEDPASVLSVGQDVKVKVLKVEQGGKRISLSMKALEPDPWKDLAGRFSEGSVVQGTVERTASFGAFVQLEPGLTGLLPASVLNLPRDASIGRIYSPGKQISVMVMSVDTRRRRISLALEGSQTEGSRSDFESYKKQTREESPASGFNALAAAFQKIREES